MQSDTTIPNNYYQRILFLKTPGNKFHQFFDAQIIQIECDNDNLTFSIDENGKVQKYFGTGSLKALMQQLPSGIFMRINQSNIINGTKVIDFFELKKKNYVLLSNNIELPSTPSGWKIFKSHILCYKPKRKKK